MKSYSTNRRSRVYSPFFRVISLILVLATASPVSWAGNAPSKKSESKLTFDFDVDAERPANSPGYEASEYQINSENQISSSPDLGTQNPRNPVYLPRNRIPKRVIWKRIILATIGATLLTMGVVICLLQPWTSRDNPEGNKGIGFDGPLGPNSPKKADPAAKPEPSAFQRGMYLSVWSQSVQASQSGRYANILDDSQKIDKLLRFIESHKIDSLALFNIPLILDTKEMAAKLADFIPKARAKGIKEIYAAGSKNYDFLAMSYYQEEHPNHFDGLITELEFWNAPDSELEKTYQTYLDMLKYMRSLRIPVNGKPVKIAAYLTLKNNIPNISEQTISDQVTPLVDQIITTCYGNNPTESLIHCTTALTELLKSGSSFQIVPVLSTESSDFNGSGGKFWYMGDYLKANSNLDGLESAFWSDLRSQFNSSQIRATYYYEYIYLDYAINPSG